MNDERDYQRHKREYLDALKGLGLELSDAEVEVKLRRTQACAQEHDVPMFEIVKRNLRRALREPLVEDGDE